MKMIKESVVKLSKERLNKLFALISEDNFEYGLLLKMIYVYGRSIGEVLKLKKSDVDLKHNTVDFTLPSESVSFPLVKDIKDDLLFLIAENKIVDDDFIFIERDTNISGYTKTLNSYLANNIKEWNNTVFIRRVPVLVSSDFKYLRGQHLFLDGADMKTINALYHNKNPYQTKLNIHYKDLLKYRFPCDHIDKVFNNYTDLFLFCDEDLVACDIFTVSKDDESVIIEYDYVSDTMKIIGGEDNLALVEYVSGLEDNLFHILSCLDNGNYKFFDGYCFMKS